MRLRTAMVTAAVTLLGGVAAVVVAAPAMAAGPTATFVKTSDWGSGWEGKYTITNGGTTTMNGGRSPSTCRRAAPSAASGTPT